MTRKTIGDSVVICNFAKFCCSNCFAAFGCNPYHLTHNNIIHSRLNETTFQQQQYRKNIQANILIIHSIVIAIQIVKKGQEEVNRPY